MSWKPEVIADSSGKWAGNNLAFETQAEAETWARDLMSRWMLVTDTRAVESDEPVNYAIRDGRVVRLESSGGIKAGDVAAIAAIVNETALGPVEVAPGVAVEVVPTVTAPELPELESGDAILAGAVTRGRGMPRAQVLAALRVLEAVAPGDYHAPRIVSGRLGGPFSLRSVQYILRALYRQGRAERLRTRHYSARPYFYRVTRTAGTGGAE